MNELNEWQQMLLHYIKIDGNVNDLIYSNHTMDDVMNTIHKMVECGVLYMSEDKYHLTENGDELLIKSRRHKKGIYKFLFGNTSKIIDSIGIEDVYIPRKRRIKK